MTKKQTFYDNEILEPSKRKTILLLSDDLRSSSGVGTMSELLVRSTSHRFNWIQLAAAINHPQQGKVLDYSKEAETKWFKGTEKEGLINPNIKLYFSSGYGNKRILNKILELEKVDAIIHFTDPRFWTWLYQMDNLIRSKNIPIIYWALWDNLPYPLYNSPAYSSCDLILSISQQSQIIHEAVLKYASHALDKKLAEHTKVKYVPHGIDSEIFYPINTNSEEFKKLLEFKKSLFKHREHDPKFVVLFNGKNMRRKSIIDILQAWKIFISADEQYRKNSQLILKTSLISNSGTDLISVYKDIIETGPDYTNNVLILTQHLTQQQLNYLYNIADVTISLSTAEGFGLTTAESLMAGTPIIAPVTGGLQDQMGFKQNDGKKIKLSYDYPSNQAGRYTNHGEWAFPLWPITHSVGSPITPYIYDALVNIKEVINYFNVLYHLDDKEKQSISKAARNFMLENLSAKVMSILMIKYIEQYLNENNETKAVQNLFKSNFKLIDIKQLQMSEKIYKQNKKYRTGLYNPITEKYI